MRRYLCCFWMGLLSLAPALAQDKPEQAPAAEQPLEARAEGVLLTYRAVDLAKGKKAELETLARLDGTLRVDKSVGVRRDALPPGEYSVRVETHDESALTLVIETVGAPREAPPAPETRPAGGKGRKPPTDDKEAKEAPDERPANALEKKSDETGPPRAPAGAKAGDGDPQKPPPGNEKQSAPKVDRLRVPLKLGTAAKVTRLGVELKLTDKGNRLRFTLRAGAASATGSVRFGGEI